MNYEAVNNYIHKAVMYGAPRIGLDASYLVLAPLTWYIGTGRASYDFTARLATKKPYRVFQVLHKPRNAWYSIGKTRAAGNRKTKGERKQ